MMKRLLIALVAALAFGAPAYGQVILDQAAIAQQAFWNLKVTDDGSGNKSVNVVCTSGCGTGGGSVTITGALPSGANTIGSVGVVGALPVGANTIGTVGLIAGTANIGVTGVAQGSTTSGQNGDLAQGAVTTTNPSYTTGQTSPLSLTPTGQLRAALYSSAGTAFGVTTSGGGLLTGGQYLTAPPTLSGGGLNTVQLNSTGSQFVDTSGRESTYSCSTNVTLAATPTDVITIYGSATTIVRIRHVEVSGIATVAGGMQGTLTVRSAVDTGGTNTVTTAAPLDSVNNAAGAICRAYTANPGALGTAVGAIRTVNIPMPLIAGGVPPISFDFSTRNSQPVVLRGTTQGLVLNLGGGAVPTGGTVQVAIEWTEN